MVQWGAVPWIAGRNNMMFCDYAPNITKCNFFPHRCWCWRWVAHFWRWRWSKAFQHNVHLLTDCHETGNFGQRPLLPAASFTICSKVQQYSASSPSSVVSIPVNSISIKSSYVINTVTLLFFNIGSIKIVCIGIIIITDVGQTGGSAKRLPISYSDLSCDIRRQHNWDSNVRSGKCTFPTATGNQCSEVIKERQQWM